MKYFFFDLDGSLMYNKKSKSNETFIPKNNVEYLLKMQENNNVQYGIASGRIASVSKRLFDAENLNGWIIGENGGTILSPSNEYVYKNRISASTYLKMAKFAFDNNYHFEAYTDDKLFVNNTKGNESVFLDKITKNYEKILHINNIDSIEEFEKHLNQINHFSFVPYVDQSNLDDIKNFLTNFDNELDWINSSIDIVDTMPKDIDKVVAFKKFIELNNINPNDIHYLGDGFNDLKSFEYFENIYVMDHAHEDLKKHAKHIVSDASEAIAIFLEDVK